MVRRSIVLLLVLSLSLPAMAKDAKIGSTSVTLTAPPGHCELEQTDAADARIIKAIEGMLASDNRLLAAFADCKQLTQWRAGKRPLLDDIAQYQTPARTVDAPAPAAPEDMLKQVCAKMREEGEKTVAGLAADIKTRIEQVMKDVKHNQMRFLGVVAEEPTACYAVIVQRFKAETGKDVTQAALFATTFVKGKLVYYYLFAPYQSPYTVTALLAKHKVNVAALLSANKD
jgi:hypothetical protein